MSPWSPCSRSASSRTAVIALGDWSRASDRTAPSSSRSRSAGGAAAALADAGGGTRPLEVHLTPAPRARRVALGARQALEQTGLEPRRVPARQLDRAGGVAEDLDGFDPGDVIEEPAARREHPQGVTLELEQLPRPGRRRCDPAAARIVRADHAAVGIACGPWIAEQFGALALEAGVQLSGEPLEALAQRGDRKSVV